MEKQINQTLLTKLFDSPNPLEDKRNAFNTLYDRIFPDKAAFRFFLSTNNYDEQLRTSKILIHRMCFESNFPPAYDLLLNLLQYENMDINKSQSSAYIPQDHFVHILNSYIFGVYLFFYHPVLSSKLTKYFIGSRERNENLNPVLNASKDFISFWKYFCLFHDIAYPLEGAYSYQHWEKYFKSADRNENIVISLKSSSNSKFINAFREIPKSNIKEWCALAAARFLTLFELFNDEANKPAYDLFLNGRALYSCAALKENLYELNSLSDILKKYTCIDKLLSFEHIKLLNGFVDKTEMLIIIIDNQTLIPVAFKCFEGQKELIYIIENDADRNSALDIEKIFNLEEDYHKSKYIVRCCIKNCEEKLRMILPHWGLKKFGQKELNIIKEEFIKETPDSRLVSDSNIKFENITESSELNDYIFRIFRNIFEYWNKTIIEDKKTIAFDLITKERDNVIKHTDDLIIKSEVSKYKETLFEILKDHIEKFSNKVIGDDNRISIKLYEIMAKEIMDDEKTDDKSKENIANFINEIKSIINYVCKRFADEEQDHGCIGETLYLILYEKITKLCNTNSSIIQLLSNFWSVIQSQDLDFHLCNSFFNLDDSLKWNEIPTICKIAIPESIEPKDEYDIKPIKHFIEDILFSISDVVEKFSNHLMTSDFLASNYMNENFCLDHGIWSCYVYIISEIVSYTNIYRLFSNSCKDEKTFNTAIPFLVWPISQSYEIKLKNKYKLISKETAKSIFVHNIYGNFVNEIPEKESKWNIDLNSEPCVYFALLVDALQKWDRKQYVSPITNYRTLYKADSFNIEIVNKKLRISMHCNAKDIDDLNFRFRKDLDTYLKDASDLIELRFI
ncbi:MAG: hypothetical protein IJT36_00390 [Alphaproteobacteria bacterium]|nr:hypothetical protein [Alphaproteobacteria bacterium]